jgi:hypothetical protein
VGIEHPTALYSPEATLGLLNTQTKTAMDTLNTIPTFLAPMVINLYNSNVVSTAKINTT